MIRVAVVEDDPRLRPAIVARLRRQSGFEVVGDWESADEAARQVDWCDVDALVVDLEVPGSLSSIGLIGRAGRNAGGPLPGQIHD